MRKLLVALGGLFLCLAANAQNTAVGSLTAQGVDCTTAGACITLQFEANDVASASIQLSGTFTATVQFEASSDKGTTWVAISGTPLNSSATATSATTANTWKFNVASITNIRARASAWTSAPTVVIRSSRAVANAIGSAVYASGNGTNNVIPKGNGANQFKDSSLVDDGAGNITIPGAIANQGTLTVSQLATPANATLVVTGGVGTNYTYKLVAKAGSLVTAANSGVSTAVGPTTLDGTHFIDINFVSQTGCTSIDVYRSVGGAAQGKIGNVACTTSGAALTLRDNALVGDASTAPTVNTTGQVIFPNGTMLTDDAANSLILKNGTNAQTYKIYNTDDGAGNSEFLQITWAGNLAKIFTTKTGTGSNRTFQLGASGGANWQITSAGHLQATGDNSTDIGNTAANRPRSIYAATDVNIESASNGAQWKQGYATELLTLSTSGTTTDTAANLLPANAIIEAVVCRVTTTITTATNWSVGDATIAARFAASNSTLTAGTTSVGLQHVDQTGTSGPKQTAASKVRITTTGTPGAGIIRITVFYRVFTPPTS